MGSRDYGHNLSQDTLLWALANPIRRQILELVTRHSAQTFSASQLRDVLAREGVYAEIRQVAYHVAQLTDTELLPRQIPGG